MTEDLTPTRSGAVGLLTRELSADLTRLGLTSRSVQLRAVLGRPGVRAVALYRLQLLADRCGFRVVATLIYSLNAALHGCELLVGCRVGPGFVMRHPSGIVVGHNVVVGADCTLLQGVTLGERHGDGKGDHSNPVLGDRVTISANASVLGGVLVGDDVTVGAHALVLCDLPAGVVAVGVPAGFKPPAPKR